jgi:hypothetical protein
VVNSHSLITLTIICLNFETSHSFVARMIVRIESTLDELGEDPNAWEDPRWPLFFQLLRRSPLLEANLLNPASCSWEGLLDHEKVSLSPFQTFPLFRPLTTAKCHPTRRTS